MRVDAGIVPGGVYFQTFADGKLILERKVSDPDESMFIGPHDRDQAMQVAKHTIELYAWDGDTGLLMAYQKVQRVLGEWEPTEIFWSDAPTDA